MPVVDQIVLKSHSGVTRTIELHSGDLLELEPAPGFDVLIVSAYPDDYLPTPNSLIGALQSKGVSVAELASQREVDLRRYASCWLSQPIRHPALPYRRILCFEPRVRGKAEELTGDIFRSLAPFAGNDGSVSTVALPLVAAGDQGDDPVRMLRALVTAAVQWLKTGMSLARFAIFVRPDRLTDGLRAEFATQKALAADEQVAAGSARYDLFMSYSWQDKEEVNLLVARLKDSRPQIRLFVDRLELKPGVSWQQDIYEALDSARRVVCCLTPHYLDSKMCQEEFNIAAFRAREADDRILVPVYLKSADLPSYMKVKQYIDAREGAPEKLAFAANTIVADA